MPDIAGNVLEGLKIGEQRRQAALAQKLAQQKADQENANEQARLDILRESHAAETAHQKAVLKAAEAVHTSQRLMEFQKIGQNIQEGAPVPPGLNVFHDTAPGQDTVQDLNNTQDQQVPGIIGNVPLPVSMQVQQPGEYAKQFAARSEVEEAPKRATQAALQNAELIRQIALAKSREEANATQREADRVSREKIQGEANQTRLKAALISASRASSNNQNLARLDRSYNTNAAALTKVETPISDALTRMGKLEDTINYASPATDPLIAPELLTIMAGGPQSGLRMNEAEIARIVGGRSNFEGLKSTLNKWTTDPSKPFLLTPAQRAQTKSLVQVVGERLRAKQDILTKARQALIDGQDPDTHRRVLATALESIGKLDQPQLVKIKAPDGSIAEFPPDLAKHYISLGATEVK